ncbi:MAG: YfhO family protein [Oscillospiraceae bacterium]|jgi:uncharacterized membrane protein YfhO|nr:YfhO family protein [Oscillospiraceae bacterium]
MAAKPQAKKATSPLQNINPKNIDWSLTWLRFQKWTYNNRWYFFAFILPVVILYIAFAKFGFYPFGDRSVLVLDLNGQYIYFYEYMHDVFRGDGSIFYTWSKSLSGEFMGTLGYYVASPFNIVIWLLPRSMILGAVYLSILLKIGTSAVTFLFFMRKTSKISFLHGTVFATCYALMAYMVVQTMDPMWLDGLVFLPLIILGIRKLVDRDLKVGYIIPLALMLIANFYIGMQICIFCVIYFVYYVIWGTNRFEGKWNSKKGKDNSVDFLTVCVRFGICSILAACLAAFLLIPVYNALKLGKMDFSKPDMSLKAKFEMLDFLPRLLPNSYDTCRPEGMMDIYAGVLSVLLLPLFFLNSKIALKHKVGHAFLLGAMLFSMYINPVNLLWHGGQDPNWLPYRYSFIFSFIVVSAAAYAFSELEGISTKAIGGSFVAIIATFFILETRDFAAQTNYSKPGFDVFKILWFSAALIAIYAVIIGMLKKYPKSYTLSVVLLAVVSGELYINTFNTVNAMNTDVGYSLRSSYVDFAANSREIVDKLEEDDNSLWRGEKTYQRMINDPMALGLRGISHSTSVMNDDILVYLEKLGFMSNGYRSVYKGSTPISDSLLGMKYILERTGRTTPIGWAVDPTYTPLDKYTTSFYDADLATSNMKDKKGEPINPNPQKNDTISVYQNPNALSMGYMVDAGIQKIVKFDGFNVFWNQNTLLSTLVGKAQGVGTTTPTPVEYFKRIPLDEEPIMTNVTFDEGYNHYNRTGSESADHTVEYHLTATTNDPIYLYFATGDQKEVNIWLQTNKDENGNFLSGFESVGTYFENENFGIMKLGQFAPGTQIAVRVTVLKAYTEIDDAFFYYLDMPLYQTDIDILKSQQWDIKKWSTTHIEGNIVAKDNQIMLTSIPWEPGWSVKVDGKSVAPIKVISALVGIPLSPGEHTVEMTFTPNGFPIGVVLGIIALAACVFFIWYDRKHNAVYIEKIKAKKEYLKNLKPNKPALKKSTNAYAKLKADIEKAVATEDKTE